MDKNSKNSNFSDFECNFCYKGYFHKICKKKLIFLYLSRGILRHQLWPVETPPSGFWCFSIFSSYFINKIIILIFLRSLYSFVQIFTNFRWKSVEKQFVKVDHFTPYFSTNAYVTTHLFFSLRKKYCIGCYRCFNHCRQKQFAKFKPFL